MGKRTIIRLIVGAILAFCIVRYIIPPSVAPRVTSQGSACINNLRLIDGAKQQWALDNQKSSNAIPTWNDLVSYLGRGPNAALPTCPNGGVYTISSLSKPPTCSIPEHVLAD
jgi:hypothetical protein